MSRLCDAGRVGGDGDSTCTATFGVMEGWNFESGLTESKLAPGSSGWLRLPGSLGDKRLIGVRCFWLRVDGTWWRCCGHCPDRYGESKPSQHRLPGLGRRGRKPSSWLRVLPRALISLHNVYCCLRENPWRLHCCSIQSRRSLIALTSSIAMPNFLHRASRSL